jgi:hypothetical protein
MIEIVWEFVAKPEAIERFQAAYGPGGEWARLFGGHAGYRGTTLLRDTANPRRFLTIDRWDSADDHARMRAAAGENYDRLDRACEALTESERELGTFAAGEKAATVEPATAEAIEAEIRQAFAGNERPGNWALRGSNEGEEPYLVEKDFADKPDWRGLDAAFLDQAPAGFASALSFFSDEAFRYFLPAYLIADLKGELQRADPDFLLGRGLEDATRAKPHNPRRFGDRSWRDAVGHRLGTFTPAESRAIVSYLRFKAATDEFSRRNIEEAIAAFWAERAARP